MSGVAWRLTHDFSVGLYGRIVKARIAAKSGACMNNYRFTYNSRQLNRLTPEKII